MERVLAIGVFVSALTAAASAQPGADQQARCRAEVEDLWAGVVEEAPEMRARTVSAHFSRERGACLLIEESSQPADAGWSRESIVTRVFDVYAGRNVVVRRHFKGDSPERFAFFYWPPEEEWREATAADQKRFRSLLAGR
jgi:hypothetical protein